MADIQMLSLLNPPKVANTTFGSVGCTVKRVTLRFGSWLVPG